MFYSILSERSPRLVQDHTFLLVLGKVFILSPRGTSRIWRIDTGFNFWTSELLRTLGMLRWLLLTTIFPGAPYF